MASNWDIIINYLVRIPGLGFVIDYILTKIGILKDYKTLYQTEQKLKSLGNALRTIGVPFDKIAIEENLDIPIVLLFRQKGNSKLAPNILRQKGFESIDKSFGLYVLPPLQTKENNLKNGHDLEVWLNKEFGVSQISNVNIRFCALTDLKYIFSFKDKTLKAKTLIEILTPHLIEFIGVKKAFEMSIDYVKTTEHKSITEMDIIDLTPLQHIFADSGLDNKALEKLEKKEKEMLDYLQKEGLIHDYTFLSISKISNDDFKKCVVKFIGSVQNIDEIIKKAHEMANFIANKL
jgi:hypothetical protein